MTLDAARERLALVVTLLGFASFLSLTPTLSAQSLVALAARAAATALLAHCPVVSPHAAPASLQPRRRAAAVPLVLAGRTTDVVHHPVRPRAPGLV